VAGSCKHGNEPLDSFLTSRVTISFSRRTLLHGVCYEIYMKMYPKVSGLATWSENCKWYSSLPLGAVVLLFCESV
jgi:hypothetical protein